MSALPDDELWRLAGEQKDVVDLDVRQNHLFEHFLAGIPPDKKLHLLMLERQLATARLASIYRLLVALEPHEAAFRAWYAQLTSGPIATPATPAARAAFVARAATTIRNVFSKRTER